MADIDACAAANAAALHPSRFSFDANFDTRFGW